MQQHQAVRRGRRERTVGKGLLASLQQPIKELLSCSQEQESYHSQAAHKLYPLHAPSAKPGCTLGLKAEQQQYAQGSKHDAEWTNQNSMMVDGQW